MRKLWLKIGMLAAGAGLVLSSCVPSIKPMVAYPQPSWIYNPCGGLPDASDLICFRGKTPVPFEGRNGPPGAAEETARRDAQTQMSEWMTTKIGSKAESKMKAAGEALEGASVAAEAKRLTRVLTTNTLEGFYCDSIWWESNAVNSQKVRLFDVYARCRIKRETIKVALQNEASKAEAEATAGSKIAKVKLKAMNEISKEFDSDPFYK